MAILSVRGEDGVVREVLALRGPAYELTDGDKAKIVDAVLEKMMDNGVTVFGDLVVRGTDGIERQIVFNTDGACTWVALNITEEVVVLTADDFAVGGMDADGVPSTSGTSTTRMYTGKLELPANGAVSVDCTTDAAWIVYFYNSADEAASTLVGKSAFSSNGTDDIKNVTLSAGTAEGATHFRISLRDASSGSLSDKKDEMMEYVTVTITKRGADNDE